MQQQRHEQHPEFSKLGLHSHTASPLTTSGKLPVVASPAASPSLVCDSLERFVSKVDARSRAAAGYPTSIRSPSSNPDSVPVNAIGRKEDPMRQSSSFLDDGMDTLEAFVVHHSAPPAVSESAKNSIQYRSGLGVQSTNHDDSHNSDVLPKSLQPYNTPSTFAFQPAGSKSVQKTSAHSLYRIDSASPSLDEVDAPKSHPLQFVPRREIRQGENNGDASDGSWMLPQHASPAIHMAIVPTANA